MFNSVAMGLPGASYRWGVVAALIALPALVPVLVVLAALLYPDTQVLGHIIQQVLPRVVVNTLMLAVLVTVFATGLGVILAWLTAVCEFPGRRFFTWALFMPLALPGYVMAFVIVGWFEYAGPIQEVSRTLFGTSAWIPQVRSLGGVVLTLTLVLFPYPYLIARNAFLTQGQRSLEVGQSLGLDRSRGFFRVAIPLARPWIVGGAMLVLMETLADFGTVSVFNFDTFTTAIYKSWFGLFSITGALQLASVLLLVVAVIVFLERKYRAQRGYQAMAGGKDPARRRTQLKGIQRGLAVALCIFVFLIAFVLPVIQLGIWAWDAAPIDLDRRYGRFVLNSLFLSVGSAVLIALLAVLLAYAIRRKGMWSGIFARIATAGYALPGAVLAVGIFVPVAAGSRFLQNALTTVLGPNGISIALQGTLLVMFLAYVARFMAVGYTPVESNMLRITANLDDASRSMGVTGLAMLRRLHFPILKGGILTALALVFVDTMKELPITLMTRPFGWDTLAIRIFELTSEGFWERAALPALAIVLVGLMPVAILIWKSEHAA